MTLSELGDDLYADFGPAHYARRDMKIAHPVNKKERTARLANDGVKYLMAEGGWLLIRPSGTEPVLRVYAEAPEVRMTEALLEYGQVAAGIS